MNLQAYIQITRPGNCVIGAMSIAVAAALAGPIRAAQPVVIAVASGLLLIGGANVINDFFDLEIDRINRPDRVLPARKMRPEAALAFAIILFVSGVFFSIFIHKIAAGIAALSAFLLIVYSASLKRKVIWGNILVSLMTGVAFIYGAIAAGSWADGLIPAVFSFFFHFGREIIKDLEDMAGDAAHSANTLPIRFGKQAAIRVVAANYIVLILLTLVPYAEAIYGNTYLLIVIPGVDLVLGWVVVYLLWRGPRINLRKISRVLKADMVVGLIAVYFGR